jgi:hypothetical protein
MSAPPATVSRRDASQPLPAKEEIMAANHGYIEANQL